MIWFKNGVLAEGKYLHNSSRPRWGNRIGLNTRGGVVNPGKQTIFASLTWELNQPYFFGVDDPFSCTEFLLPIWLDFTNIFVWLIHLVILELGMGTTWWPQSSVPLFRPQPKPQRSCHRNSTLQEDPGTERHLYSLELRIWSLLSPCFKQREIKPHHAIACNFHLEITLQENGPGPLCQLILRAFRPWFTMMPDSTG